MGRYAQTCPIIYGAGTIGLLGEEAKKLGCTKVMIVSDKIISKLEGYAKAKESLIASGIKIVEFNKVIADPPDYIINEGGDIAKSEKIDGIVAIGGGSPMDAAKGINVLVNNPGPVNKYFGNPFYNPGVPIIMIVATAGTGSESTSIGVITDTINNVKNSVICNSTLGILDPGLTTSVSASMTAITGIDAMSHAAESITAKFSNPKSELLATDAIKKIMKYLPIAISDGENIEARENLLIASNFAGLAFNDALVHIGHAIAHSIGAKFHVAHGIGCGLAMPEVMKYAANFKADKVKIIGEAMGISFNRNETNIEIGEIVAHSMRKFMKKIGIKSLEELDIERGKLIGIADVVLSDECYNFVPKQLSKEEIEKILECMYDNYK